LKQGDKGYYAGLTGQPFAARLLVGKHIIVNQSYVHFAGKCAL